MGVGRQEIGVWGGGDAAELSLPESATKTKDFILCSASTAVAKPSLKRKRYPPIQSFQFGAVAY